jgi:hypothetical protein
MRSIFQPVMSGTAINITWSIAYTELFITVRVADVERRPARLVDGIFETGGVRLERDIFLPRTLSPILKERIPKPIPGSIRLRTALAPRRFNRLRKQSASTSRMAIGDSYLGAATAPDVIEAAAADVH